MNVPDLVADDLVRGVPDAEVFLELGVEGFQKRLVEVRDGGSFLKTLQKGFGVHAPQHVEGAVNRGAQVQPGELTGGVHLVKQQADDGNIQVVGDVSTADLSALACPGSSDPPSEQSVKEGLHQTGTEEVIEFGLFLGPFGLFSALLFSVFLVLLDLGQGETGAQGVFHRFAQRGQGVGVLSFQVVHGLPGIVSQ